MRATGLADARRQMPAGLGAHAPPRRKSAGDALLPRRCAHQSRRGAERAKRPRMLWVRRAGGRSARSPRRATLPRPRPRFMTKRPSAAECVATTLRRRCHDAATPCWNVVRCSACNILHCATYIIRACVDACEGARVFDRVRAAHEGVRMAPLTHTGVRMLCRCESGEPSPGADVAAFEHSPGADMEALRLVPAQMWQR